MGKKLAGWLHTKSCNQCLNVQIEFSSKWCPLRGLHWEWCLFSVFINYINSGIVCILSKFAGDTKLSGVSSTRWREGMPSRGTLTGWRGGPMCKPHRSSTRPSAISCTWVWAITSISRSWADEWPESSPEEKDLGAVLVGEKLRCDPAMCTLAAQKASPILGCVESKCGQQIEGGDCPSLYSALMRAHLEYCIQPLEPPA